MGTIYVYYRLLVTKCLKIQLKIGSLVSFLLCVDTTLAHFLNYVPLWYLGKFVKWSGLELKVVKRSE